MFWPDRASDSKELKAFGKSLAVASWSGGVGSRPNSARQSFSEIKFREAKKLSPETAVSTRFSNGATSDPYFTGFLPAAISLHDLQRRCISSGRTATYRPQKNSNLQEVLSPPLI